jgi:hypothetical protein
MVLQRCQRLLAENRGVKCRQACGAQQLDEVHSNSKYRNAQQGRRQGLLLHDAAHAGIEPWLGCFWNGKT